jgi:hypothetical protein
VSKHSIIFMGLRDGNLTSISPNYSSRYCGTSLLVDHRYHVLEEARCLVRWVATPQNGGRWVS